MKLITEEVARVKFIVEGKGSQKKMYIEGVFLQGEIKNRNGRMYPINTLAKEVNRYNESFVKKGRALDVKEVVSCFDFALSMGRGANIRDLVILPTNQNL